MTKEAEAQRPKPAATERRRGCHPRDGPRVAAETAHRLDHGRAHARPLSGVARPNDRQHGHAADRRRPGRVRPIYLGHNRLSRRVHHRGSHRRAALGPLWAQGVLPRRHLRLLGWIGAGRREPVHEPADRLPRDSRHRGRNHHGHVHDHRRRSVLARRARQISGDRCRRVRPLVGDRPHPRRIHHRQPVVELGLLRQPSVGPARDRALHSILPQRQAHATDPSPGLCGHGAARLGRDSAADRLVAGRHSVRLALAPDRRHSGLCRL